MLILLTKWLYKYEHKKVNKNIFFVLIINFFRIKLRGKAQKWGENGRNLLILNGFKVFHTHSENALQFFNNSVGIALSYWYFKVTIHLEFRVLLF